MPFDLVSSADGVGRAADFANEFNNLRRRAFVRQACDKSPQWLALSCGLHEIQRRATLRQRLRRRLLGKGINDMPKREPDTSETWIVNTPVGTYYSTTEDGAMRHARCILREWPDARVRITHVVEIRTNVPLPVMKKPAKARARKTRSRKSTRPSSPVKSTQVEQGIEQGIEQ